MNTVCVGRTLVTYIFFHHTLLGFTGSDVISRAPHETQLKQAVTCSLTLTIIPNKCWLAVPGPKGFSMLPTNNFAVLKSLLLRRGLRCNDSYKYGDNHEHYLTVSPERHSWCALEKRHWWGEEWKRKLQREVCLVCFPTSAHLPNLWMKRAFLSNYSFGKVTKMVRHGTQSQMSKRCEGRRFQTLFNKSTCLNLSLDQSSKISGWILTLFRP